MPTPESSDGTALSVFVLPTLGGPLVTDMLRMRLTGVPALAFPLGVVAPAREVVTKDAVLPVVIFESTALVICRLAIFGDAVTPALRLPGRIEPTTEPSVLDSGERSRVPNLDSFAGVLPANDDGAWYLGVSCVREALVDCPRLANGLVRVTLSAPQYEKLILLLRSESSLSFTSPSSSGESPVPMI